MRFNSDRVELFYYLQYSERVAKWFRYFWYTDCDVITPSMPGLIPVASSLQVLLLELLTNLSSIAYVLHVSPTSAFVTISP
jgi:hypothetical protein